MIVYDSARGSAAGSADEFRHIGDEREAQGEWFRAAAEEPEPAKVMNECGAPLNQPADLEEADWLKLRSAVES